MNAPHRGRRRRATWVRAGLVLAVTACGKGASKGTGFDGRFSPQTAQGGQDLLLTQGGDEVRLTMNGEDVMGRVVSPGRAEGSKTEEGADPDAAGPDGPALPRPCRRRSFQPLPQRT